jgi:hypothetical protein
MFVVCCNLSGFARRLLLWRATIKIKAWTTAGLPFAPAGPEDVALSLKECQPE